MLTLVVVLARAAHIIGVGVLFGLAVFPLYAGTEWAAEDLGARRLVWALRGAAGLALTGAVAVFLATAGVMSGDLAQALDMPTLAAIAQGTDFGRVWIARLGLGAVLLAWSFFTNKPGGRLFAALAAALLASIALTGHAQMQDGAAGLIHGAADALHLLAAGWWIGGLTALLLTQDASRPAGAVGRVLAGFSGVGYGAVAVLIATGLINSAYLVGAPTALLTTPYGRLLCLKLILFAGMAALALANHLRVTPGLGRAGAGEGAIWVARLCRNVLLEHGLGLLVLVVVAALCAGAPPVSL